MVISNLNISAGTLIFCTETERCLFLLRGKNSHENTWAFTGGKIDASETILEGLEREIKEELGFMPSIEKHIPIDTHTNIKKKFSYQTFVSITNKEFIPVLNDEHKGYAWTTIDSYPKPLHPGVFTTLKIDEIMNKIITIHDIFT